MSNNTAQLLERLIECIAVQTILLRDVVSNALREADNWEFQQAWNETVEEWNRLLEEFNKTQQETDNE